MGSPKQTAGDLGPAQGQNEKGRAADTTRKTPNTSSPEPGSSFIPINRDGRFPFASSQEAPMHRNDASPEQQKTLASQQEQLPLSINAPLKRVRTGSSSLTSSRPKRQHQMLAISSPSPFQTLNVTEFLKPPTSLCELQTSPTYSGQFSGSASSLQRTTMQQMTPYPTRQLYAAKQDTAWPNHQDRPMTKGTEDEYPIDESILEDLASLLDTTNQPVAERHIPSSSVAQAWDHDSRSARDFDPSLQHSSPRPPEESTVMKKQPSFSQEELLDDEVDWNAVFSVINELPKDPSLVASPEMADQPGVQDHDPQSLVKESHRTEGSLPLKPFARPPFPDKVRDRSAVPGLSSSTVLRTCFRIGEMMNQAARCHNHQQDVVFELYARVTYSKRESLARVQHFQFADLFKDQQPYPTGTLSGWRVKSQLDRHSSSFLTTENATKLCRCMCKPKRDPKAAMGWFFVVLDVRETDWAQIRWAKMMITGIADEEEEEVRSRL
ncbi:hypothetical protein F4778DRAFT_722197 [Xylariomycetidae sp. FL2044]|nr:hypothetical protein F4778DRAFT_722197 [Xylariomycetidae sp. FL2044]